MPMSVLVTGTACGTLGLNADGHPRLPLAASADKARANKGRCLAPVIPPSLGDDALNYVRTLMPISVGLQVNADGDRSYH